MKLTTKYSLLLVLCVILSQSAFSQDDRDFRIGFKISPGLNWVKPKSNNVQRDGMGIGFSFGLMADIRLADNYFASTELLVTSMTNKVKMKDTSIYTLPGPNLYNKVSYKYNLQYIELPLMFKFRTNESGGMRYWGQFGVAPGILIGNRVSTLASPIGASSPFPTDEKYEPNDGESDRFDFNEHEDNVWLVRASMILGLGIEYNLSGNTSFYSGLRFNNGFTDIFFDKKTKGINNVLGLEIGFFF